MTIPLEECDNAVKAVVLHVVCWAMLLILTVYISLYSFKKHSQESPADARVTRDSAVIPRWPSAAILDSIKPEITAFDPPTPKTIA